MQEIQLFNYSVWASEYQNHEQNKPLFGKTVSDWAASNINANKLHHGLTHQTPTGLQMNNGLIDLVKSEEIKSFVSGLREKIDLPQDRGFAINSMWATFIPPNGMISTHSHTGIFHGIYFLHSPVNSGMLVFDRDIPDQYYEYLGTGEIEKTPYNTNRQSYNMPEGGIIIMPSWLKHSSTSNESNETRMSINFIMDVFEK